MSRWLPVGESFKRAFRRFSLMSHSIRLHKRTERHDAAPRLTHQDFPRFIAQVRSCRLKHRENEKFSGNEACKQWPCAVATIFFLFSSWEWPKQKISRDFYRWFRCTLQSSRLVMWYTRSNMSLVTVLRSPSTSESTSLGTESVNCSLLHTPFDVDNLYRLSWSRFMVVKFSAQFVLVPTFYLIDTLLGRRRRSGR